MEMLSKPVFKRMIPVALAGAAIIVLALPIRAMAHDWHDHDKGYHRGWVHRDNDDDDRAGGWRYDYDPAPRYYPMERRPYGFSPGYANNSRMTYLDHKWKKVESKHQWAVATGHRHLAKQTSKHLYKLDRKMGMTNPNSRYGYGYYYPYNR